MMNKTLCSLALVASLAACNKGNDHTIVAGPEGDDLNAVDTNVVLPPSIAATKTYRCADNTVVSIDWMNDGKSAGVRVGEGSSTMVTADAAGGEMKADGYALSGSQGAKSIKLALPGKSTQTCNG